MKFKIVKRCQEDLGSIHGLLKSFLPFAKKRMGFNKPPTIYFQSDDANANKLLGKTAHYDPTTLSVTIYVTGRHPKDVLRSLSHELVHHGQNCRGEFGRTSDTSPGYAQKDNHLRGMEIEAYREGNLCLRDWEDGIKTNKIPISMPLRECLFNNNNIGEKKMKLNEWKQNELNRLLMEKFNLSEGGREHAPSGDGVRHKVAGGETLSGIATKYEVTVDQLKARNNLKSDDIEAGQVLDIPRQDWIDAQGKEKIEEGHGCGCEEEHPDQSHEEYIGHEGCVEPQGAF